MLIPDLILSVVWLALVVTGTVFQIWREKGRAPFPPPPTWNVRRSGNLPTSNNQPDSATEASPLLS